MSGVCSLWSMRESMEPEPVHDALPRLRRDFNATLPRLWRVLVTFQQRFVCVCVRAVAEFWQLSDALKVCQFPSHIWPNAQELLLGAWPLQPAYKTKFDDVQQL